jgi:Integrase zinc binding domain
MSTVPSGDWLCPACDPIFRNFEELYDANTPLKYHAHDPYNDVEFMAYLQGGLQEDLLPTDLKRARKLQHMACCVREHDALPGWLMVRRRQRCQSAVAWLVCPPVEYRWDLLRVYHDALGHCGSQQLVTAMHQHLHWSGLKSDAQKYVKACDACQRKLLALPELPELQQPVLHAGPFRHIHIDLTGPFLTPLVSVHGKLSQPPKPVKAWVVLMIDYFTKAAEFYVVYSKEPQAVAEAVYYGWFCRYGCCEFVTTDNGSEFMAEFKHQLQRLGIKHISTSACHPAANGAVERLVRTFKDILKKHINDHPQHWIKSIPVVRMAYHSRVHKAIGVTPFEMLHGCKPRLALPVGVQFGALQVTECDSDDIDAQLYLEQLQERFDALDSQAFQLIKKQFDTNYRHWYKRCTEFGRKAKHNIAVGDLVLELDDNPDTALNAKVRGPYKVVKFIMDGAVAVLETGATGFQPAKRFRRNVSVLAKYFDKFSA